MHTPFSGFIIGWLAPSAPDLLLTLLCILSTINCNFVIVTSNNLWESCVYRWISFGTWLILEYYLKDLIGGQKSCGPDT